MQTMPYQFQSYEPGVFVELYLPKKARYQGRLYDALTDGFDFKKVKEHFLNTEKRDKIYRLLETYGEVRNIEERIDKIEQFYWGYSMYEVDGVFYNPERKIIEERTQVIRVIFLPDLKKLHKLAPEMDYIELRRLVKKALRADKDEREWLREKYSEIVDFINNWIGDVGLFLFGFIVFELCSRIKESNDGVEEELEEEVWVSSFWDILINRVKLVR